ncbi:MAG TPA: CheR family methyltransferase [Geobacteraceae bacterium]|nr:CheR family methyltransferase [Geobacteraceae bacterium]
MNLPKGIKVNFDRFLRQICPLLGLEWRKYRRRAARHRVQRRMRELGVDDLDSYLDLLRTNSEEADGLADLMRVTVSRFFRDKSCWIKLAEEVLPRIIAENTRDSTLHVWSAGCCCGEEPYTVALVWLEYLQPLFPGHSIDILATDIDEAALERARKGTYAEGSLREVPVTIREKWFHRKGGMWLLDEKVMKLVRFEKRNVMTDSLPAEIDLTLCRYLAFTYYRDRRRLEAAKRLADSLCPWGVLMIGRKETIDTSQYQFLEPWPGNECIFRRRLGACRT